MGVFYENTGYAVHSSRNYKFVVETDVLRIRLDFMVEVRSALRPQSQVPFANGSCAIAFFFEHIGHCNAGCVDDQFGVTRSDAGIFLSPGVHTCQQAETGGSACGGSGISVGKLHTLTGKAVDIRSAYFCGAIAAKVANAQIIRNKIDDIWLLQLAAWSCLFGMIATSRQEDCAWEIW